MLVRVIDVRPDYEHPPFAKFFEIDDNDDMHGEHARFLLTRTVYVTALIS